MLIVAVVALLRDNSLVMFDALVNDELAVVLATKDSMPAMNGMVNPILSSSMRLFPGNGCICKMFAVARLRFVAIGMMSV